jgi:hypothetical protein
MQASARAANLDALRNSLSQIPYLYSDFKDRSMTSLDHDFSRIAKRVKGHPRYRSWTDEWPSEREPSEFHFMNWGVLEANIEPDDLKALQEYMRKLAVLDTKNESIQATRVGAQVLTEKCSRLRFLRLFIWPEGFVVNANKPSD